MVSAHIGSQSALLEQTNLHGVARLKVLEGISYTVTATVWLGQPQDNDAAHSEPTELTPGAQTTHLKLILNRRTKGRLAFSR
jgi:hypothetical protein